MPTSATPPRAGRSSAASSPASRPVHRGRHPLHHHQSRRASRSTLREHLLRARAGREPDQGAQAAPRLRPHLLHQGHRQPVPPAGPHRRLLADAQPARSGAQDRRSGATPSSTPSASACSRSPPASPRWSPASRSPCRPLSLPGRLRHPHRPNRQAAAVTDGAVAPDRTLRPHLKPRSPASPTPRNTARPSRCRDAASGAS